MDDICADLKFVKFNVEFVKKNKKVNMPHYHFVCSNCNNQIKNIDEAMKYCYHCGAKFNEPITAEYLRKVRNGEI